MLAELLENVDSNRHVIVKDRGLFDTLLWLRGQLNRGEVTPEEAERIEQFLLMDRWTQLVDLVIVMSVDPQEAITREHGSRISNVRGSIMNEQSLAAVNEALSEAIQNYGTAFKRILTYDTTGRTPRDTNITIAHDLLGHLERFLDPKILVIDFEVLRSILSESDSCFSFKDGNDVLSQLKKHCSFMKKSEAEMSDHVVQIIPCAMLMHSGRILLFERAEKDPKVELHGRSTIWQGAHVASAECSVDALIEDALFGKLRDKLFINQRFPVTLLGYAWDRSSAEKRKHMGLFYKLAIDSEGVAVDLRKKAFRSGRGHGLNGTFLTAEELRGKADELSLEPWSRGALRAGVGGALHAET